MRVTVTKKNIDDGVACSVHRCPVALAIEDNKFIESGQTLSVGVIFAYIRVSGDIYKTCDIPDKASESIRYYDQHGFMEPFDFEIEWETKSPIFNDDPNAM